jgi:hypothetical protein
MCLEYPMYRLTLMFPQFPKNRLKQMFLMFPMNHYFPKYRLNH